MKLVIIHGPPAVGKLTVARELSKITGFNVFHNHLVNDLVEAVFEFGSEAFEKLVVQLWLETISMAATSKLKGLIITCCYAKGSDDAFIKKLVKIVEKNHGKVLSVLLTSEPNILYERVTNSSREKFGKLKDPKKLKKVLKKYELFSPIAFIENVKIDNTKISAKLAAKKIAKELELK